MSAAEIVRLVVVAVCGLAVAAAGGLLWSRPDLVLRGANAARPARPHRATGTVRRLGLLVTLAGVAMTLAGVVSALGW